jgi:hypothetical protein
MDLRTLIREAQNPQTDARRVAELAEHTDPQVRRAAARHMTLDVSTITRLLDDDAWEVRAVAAHHTKAPQDKALAIVTAMGRSADAVQRSLAARSPLTGVEDLIRLASDPDIDTRAQAVKNRRTPAATVRERLTDPEPAVVLCALGHPSLSNDERRAFITEEFLLRFFAAHADGDHLFEALCERYLWDTLERAFLDNERFDDVWQELVKDCFELVEIPERHALLAAVNRKHWPTVAARLARECGAGERSPS